MCVALLLVMGQGGLPRLIRQGMELEDRVQRYTRQTLENPDLHLFPIVQLTTIACSFPDRKGISHAFKSLVYHWNVSRFHGIIRTCLVSYQRLTKMQCSKSCNALEFYQD